MNELIYNGVIKPIKAIADKSARLAFCVPVKLSRLHAQIIADTGDEILLEGKRIGIPDGRYPSIIYPEDNRCQATPLDVKIEGLFLSDYLFRVRNPSRSRECWGDTGLVTIFEPALKDVVLCNPKWEVLYGEDVKCSELSTLIGGGDDVLLSAKLAGARLQGYLPDERHIDNQLRKGDIGRGDKS